MGKFVKVAQVSEVPPGGSRGVEIEGKTLALFNLGGTFYAIDDTCTHVGGSLSEGTLEGEEVECPWHGARFNVKSGAVCCPPAPSGVATYRVQVNGSDILVEV